MPHESLAPGPAVPLATDAAIRHARPQAHVESSLARVPTESAVHQDVAPSPSNDRWRRR